MKIVNKRLKSDISIELADDDVIKLWHELEFLSDTERIKSGSQLMLLKIMIKDNIYKLDKALSEIEKIG